MSNKQNTLNNLNKLEMATMLSKKVAEIIVENEAFLKQENKKATQDSAFAIDSDLDFIKKYLAEYVENNKDTFQKDLSPKGTVFIILSYNEPFIISVVPILNALVAGNRVVVKPSGKCTDFFKKIWLDKRLCGYIGTEITLVEKSAESEMRSLLSIVDCVYFFGSFENAKKMYQLCAELFVEFVPEIETADCKVFKFDNLSDDFLTNECESTLIQSFTHAGQTCQRISGVFVHNSNFKAYEERLKEVFKDMMDNKIEKMVPKNFVVNKAYEDKILTDIRVSNPLRVIKSEAGLPKIVVGPDTSSEFVKNGYFYPVLWLVPFGNFEELCKELNFRKFFLGINIHSDDQALVDFILNSTRFTRFTVNIIHTEVGLDEGWGGRWPSGSGGYRNWLEHFSIPRRVIEHRN